MRNIIQAEFFHVGRKGDSVETVLQEGIERLRDGSPIKTCVRFYDEGPIAALVRTTRQEEDLFEGLQRKLRGAKGMKKAFLNWRSVRSGRRWIALQRKRVLMSCERLEEIVRTAGPIAKMEDNFSFRLVARAEEHELLEAVRKARGVWLFIYESGGLLTEEHFLEVSVT